MNERLRRFEGDPPREIREPSAEYRYNLATAVDDLRLFLFESETETPWEEYTSRYSIEDFESEDQNKLREYYQRYQRELVKANEVMGHFQTRVARMPEGTDPARILMALAFRTKSSKTRLEQRGALFILHCEQSEFEESDDSAMLESEPHAPVGGLFGVYRIQLDDTVYDLPVIRFNEGVVTPEAKKSFAIHEEQHFLYDGVFGKREEFNKAGSEREKAQWNVKDELLAYISDNTPASVLPKQLEDYRYLVANLEQEERENVWGSLLEAIDALVDYDKNMVASRKRLAYSLLDVSLADIPQTIRDLTAMLDQKFSI